MTKAIFFVKSQRGLVLFEKQNVFLRKIEGFALVSSNGLERSRRLSPEKKMRKGLGFCLMIFLYARM